MNQYIYVLKPVRLEMLTEGPTDAEAAAVQGHVEHLEQQAKAGTVLLAGRTQTADSDTFGLVILQAESETEAAQMMESDPAITGQAMTATLFPYQVAVISESILSDAMTD